MTGSDICGRRRDGGGAFDEDDGSPRGGADDPRSERKAEYSDALVGTLAVVSVGADARSVARRPLTRQLRSQFTGTRS
jgi:hypothetical protein